MWLKIEADLNSQLKVTWGNKAGYYPLWYSVGAEGIHKAADAIRKQLELLSGWANTNDQTLRRAGLIALANAGKSLRYRLFNDPAKTAEIKELGEWITDEYNAGDRELAIQADSSIHVPWGLAYDGDAPAVSDGALVGETASREMAEFPGFWSMKYSLSATSSGHVRPRSKMMRSRKTFGLLSLVNRDVQTQIEHELEQVTYRGFCELLSPPVGVAYNLANCHELIDTTKQVDILFHFLGHHNDQVLDLGNGQTISYDDFSQLLDSLTGREETRGSSPCGLLFLNGCDSAVGNKDFSLRSQASRPELCGAIATESLVRRNYAAVFGYRFLQAMVNQGKTVAATMDELHHDTALWPESLLYGCYAHPDYRIEKPAPVGQSPLG
jgi:hypothetical protein